MHIGLQEIPVKKKKKKLLKCLPPILERVWDLFLTTKADIAQFLWFFLFLLNPVKAVVPPWRCSCADETWHLCVCARRPCVRKRTWKNGSSRWRSVTWALRESPPQCMTSTTNWRTSWPIRRLSSDRSAASYHNENKSCLFWLLTIKYVLNLSVFTFYKYSEYMQDYVKRSHQINCECECERLFTVDTRSSDGH